MSILILSPDAEASGLLQSALLRRGTPHVCARELDVSEEEAPLVAVVDTKLPGYSRYLEKLSKRAPWARSYVISEPSNAPTGATTPIVHKPFDAAGFAQLLDRDRELAALDRNRRSAQAQVGELALLVQTSFEAIIGLDKNRRIVSWNRGACDIYGYSEAEAIGENISLLGPEHLALVRLGPGEKQAIELTRTHKSGHQLTALVSRSRSREEYFGSSLEYAEVSLDVTAKHRLGRELEHSQRLASLGRIAATMSHEINNPLAVIRSCASWLSEYAKAEGGAELNEAADDLEASSERIATFVDQMCGFARQNPSKLSTIPLNTTIEMALRMVKPRAQAKNVELILTEAAAVTAPVHHDPSRLAHAMINLLANAIDAAAEGGSKVWLSVTTHPSDAREGVCIIVDDNGPGISDEIKECLFEPFSTTKPFGQGTGLGLALTREIVDGHNGTVHLFPRDGQGTRAELYLPLRPPRNAAT